MMAEGTVEDCEGKKDVAVLEIGKTKGQLSEDSWDQKCLHF